MGFFVHFPTHLLPKWKLFFKERLQGKQESFVFEAEIQRLRQRCLNSYHCKFSWEGWESGEVKCTKHQLKSQNCCCASPSGGFLVAGKWNPLLKKHLSDVKIKIAYICNIYRKEGCGHRINVRGWGFYEQGHLGLKTENECAELSCLVFFSVKRQGQICARRGRAVQRKVSKHSGCICSKMSKTELFPLHTWTLVSNYRSLYACDFESMHQAMPWLWCYFFHFCTFRRILT